MFTELSFEERVKRRGERGMERLRIHRLRNDAICFEQVYCHIELAAVTYKVTRKVINKAVVDRKFRVLDGELKIIVRLVQFVPKEQVGLRDRSVRCYTRAVET